MLCIRCPVTAGVEFTDSEGKIDYDLYFSVKKYDLFLKLLKNGALWI